MSFGDENDFEASRKRLLADLGGGASGQSSNGGPKQPNLFLAYHDAGFRRLVPIIPPDAEMSPTSSLFKRPEEKGKAVGYRGDDGFWRGLVGWAQAPEPTLEQLDQWHQMGAGVGIRTGQGLYVLDVDTTDPKIAARVQESAFKHLGIAPVRVGRAPKFLLMYRSETELPNRQINFPDRQQIEFRGEGKQFVAEGIHPKTRKPYEWPNGRPKYDELPIITAEQLDRFYAALLDEFPEAEQKSTSPNSHKVPDQQSLMGDKKIMRQIMADLPNPANWDRTAYRDLAFALKGALGEENDPEAFELWHDWGQKWEGGENTREQMQSDWESFRRPVKLGAEYIYRLGRQFTGFTAPPIDIKEFFDVLPQTRVPAKQPAALEWRNPYTDWAEQPPPQKWVIKNFMPALEIGLLTGSGGVGKSTLAQQLGVCLSAGTDFLGYKVERPFRVMGFFCEDSEEVLHRRHHDISQGLFLDADHQPDTLRIVSRKFMDNLLAIWQREKGVLQQTGVFEALRLAVTDFKAEVLIIDTAADTFGGSEIDRQQVRQFIQGCLGWFVRECGCAVILLAHPSRSGEQSGEGTSGSTAWHASVRSRFYLEFPEKRRPGAIRWLTNMKQQYGPPGDKLVLQFRKGLFYVAAATKPSTGGDDETTALASAPTIAESLESTLMTACSALQQEAVQLSESKNSPYYAPKVLKLRFDDAFQGYSIPEIDDAVRALFRKGCLVIGEVGRKSNRHIKEGFIVKAQPEEAENDLFG